MAKRFRYGKTLGKSSTVTVNILGLKKSSVMVKFFRYGRTLSLYKLFRCE